MMEANQKSIKSGLSNLKDTIMTEHKVITLDESDIKEIIAEKFNCDMLDVEVKVSHCDPQYPQTSVYIEIRVT